MLIPTIIKVGIQAAFYVWTLAGFDKEKLAKGVFFTLPQDES